MTKPTPINYTQSTVIPVTSLTTAPDFDVIVYGVRAGEILAQPVNRAIARLRLDPDHYTVSKE